MPSRCWNVTWHGTVRTLPNNLQGWLESQHASRSAPNKWFVHSHLLWSLGESNRTHRGHHASWPEQHRPLPWTARARPRSKSFTSKLLLHALVINFPPNLCHTNCAKEGGDATLHKHASLLEPVLPVYLKHCEEKSMWYERKGCIIRPPGKGSKFALF